MKEIKVKLYSHENDKYVELYEVIEGDTKAEFIARNTYGRGDDGEWYFVSDPHGYCELDHGYPADYVFIVCDARGNELLQDGNGKTRNPFPTLKRKAELTWYEIKAEYPCKKEGLTDWLLSFLTKEISETVLQSKPCHEANWPFWCDDIRKDVVQKFTHLGENYCIYKVTTKHRYCDCEWIEYYSGKEIMDRYTGYVDYYGACFDESRSGPNFSRKVATKKVSDALKIIYHNKYRVSYVRQTEHGDYEHRMDLYQAAELLLKGNFNREFVLQVINTEVMRRTFYGNYHSACKDFPNLVMDYSF